MLWLAFRMLFQERGSLAITLVGIVFSTVLTLVEVGIYLGMMGNATSVVRHTDADIWVASKNVPNFDFMQPFPAYRINRVRALDEVLWAEKIHLWFSFLKLADGRREQIQMIGFNPDTGIGGPWAMAAGKPADVKGGHYIIMDQSSIQRLGKLELGSMWEINLFNKEQSFKLVGLSREALSFTTIPVVFTSYNEMDHSLMGSNFEGNTSFVVVKLKDPTKTDSVAQSLRAMLPNNDVYTRQEFIDRTVNYWTIQTGIGLAFFLTAILAVLIGGAIVGQTIYAGTIEHLRDYGTLKAMGAKNDDINLVILTQAAVSAVLGFAIGVLVTLASRHGIETAGVSMQLPLLLFAVVFAIIVATCLAAAYISVRKVKTLDPVMVFRE
ncbi:MAG: FtsX-like permease family protein [Nitrosomonadales bacterium]|nr:FtsX-like permease family protein [Nitrosomonadales bacterium]